MAIRAAITTGVVYLRNLVGGTGSQTYKPAGLIYSDSTQAATAANTDLTVLNTYTMPANTLASNGDSLFIEAWGSFGANGNTKSVFLTFGGATLISISSVGNDIGWRIAGRAIRVSGTTWDGWGTTFVGVAGSNNPKPTNATSETLSGAVVIALKGLNGSASAGDIVCDGMVVKYLPAAV